MCVKICVLKIVYYFQPNEWQMLFRFTPGINRMVYESWMVNEGINEGHLKYKTSASEPIGMWKSSLVSDNRWNEIEEVLRLVVNM